jgi:hypothetical protein
MAERRGSTGRWPAWWQRVVDHLRWDEGAWGAAYDGWPGSVAPVVVVPHAAVRHVSLDQLLLRAADRRTQRGGAPA